MKQQGLVKSTVILTITSLICRTVGVTTIMYLSRHIGAEGIGLYQLIMTIYMTMIIFASSGLSVAVSRVVAEELEHGGTRHIKKIMKSVCSFGALTSIVVATILFTYAPEISRFFIKDMRGVFALKILAFSLPFIALSSCFKGYFYAIKLALKPASSDVLEQLIRLSILIILVSKWAPSGIEYACAAVATSITIGEVFSFIYMLSFYIKDRKKQPIQNSKNLSTKEVLRRILGIIIPLSIAAYIGSILMTTENVLIPIGLKKFGSSTQNSMALYGMLKGMVMPILFFPAAFLTAFATTLIPEIARANSSNNQKRVRSTIERVLKCTFLLSILVVGVFVVFSYEIGIMLYKQKAVGDMLAILALIVPFMYIEMVVDSILKGLGQQVSSLKYSIIDSIFRVVTIYFLIPIKGMVAFIGIMVLSNILTSSLNFKRLLQVTDIKINVREWIIYPAMAAVASGLIVKAILKYSKIYETMLTPQTLIGILLVCMMYMSWLFLLQIVTPKEVKQLKKSFALKSMKS
ncbi:MAG: oligosaccharide flippase family protein [Cellulosilyticaceae bacterium]